LGDLAADGRIIGDNWTPMVCEVVDGIKVRQDAEKWRRGFKNKLDLQVPSKKDNFLTKEAIIGFSNSLLDSSIKRPT